MEAACEDVEPDSIRSGMSKVIVVMGAPGAGKGTQARLLQERLHLPQISTGDIFRALKKAQTPLAQEVWKIMERGQLVPDELTIRLVKERTAKDDCKNGYILDGFPRTPAQARSLDGLAADQGNTIVAINIDVPIDLLEKRMTGRRNCPVCGEIYNIYSRASTREGVCDRCGGKLVHRSDDKEDLIRERFRTYRDETYPLVEYYRNAGVYHQVDGSRPIAEVTRDILALVVNEEPVTPASKGRNR